MLISLADQANDAGVCWPSVGTLSKRTCYQERACQKALAQLEVLGHITKVERAGRSTIFHLHPGGQELSTTPAPYAPLGVHHVRGRGARGAPRTVIEPSLKEKAGAPRERGARLPADWKPTEQQTEWAAQARPDLDLQLTADRFRDYWHGVAGAKGVKLDWPATWRNWVRGEKRANGTPTPIATTRPTIACRACGKRVTIWTDGMCDPCWRAGDAQAVAR